MIIIAGVRERLALVTYNLPVAAHIDEWPGQPIGPALLPRPSGRAARARLDLVGSAEDDNGHYVFR